MCICGYYCYYQDFWFFPWSDIYPIINFKNAHNKVTINNKDKYSAKWYLHCIQDLAYTLKLLIKYKPCSALLTIIIINFPCNIILFFPYWSNAFSKQNFKSCQDITKFYRDEYEELRRYIPMLIFWHFTLNNTNALNDKFLYFFFFNFRLWPLLCFSQI